MESDSSGILGNKYLLGFLITLIVVTGSTVGFAQYVEDVKKSIILDDNGDVIEFVTMENTVEDILKKYNIDLGPHDKVEPSKETKLKKHDKITIRRAIAATVMADNDIKTVYLTEGTVDDVLKKAGVIVGDDDIVSHSLDTPLSPGLFVTVNRIDKEIITEKSPIPFKEVVKDNDKLESGKKAVVQEGEQGELEKKIMIVYRDGEEISRELVEENILKEPKDRIIENGTKKKVVAKPKPSNRASTSKAVATKSTPSKTNNATTLASRGGSSRGTAVNFRATAYTHTGNRTCTGIWPYVGIIAVDPRVIPLNTKVYIEFPKGWEHLNGYYKAADTGGAIKGNIVDVFLETEHQCRQFGRRQVKIYFNR